MEEVFGINQFKLRNVAVVATECFFATVDRGNMMARIHRWPVMINGSLQAEFMETMQVQRSHLSLVKLMLIYLNRLTTIMKYYGGWKI